MLPGCFWLLRVKLERVRASPCRVLPRRVGRGRGRHWVAAVGFSWLPGRRCCPQPFTDEETEAPGGQATSLQSLGRSRGPFSSSTPGSAGSMCYTDAFASREAHARDWWRVGTEPCFPLQGLLCWRGEGVKEGPCLWGRALSMGAEPCCVHVRPG